MNRRAITHRLVLWSIGFAISTTLVADTHLNAAPPEDLNVIVRFRNAPGSTEENLVRRHGGKGQRKFKAVRAVATTIPADTLNQLRNEPDVLAVELDGTIEAHDLAAVWGVRRIGCGPVHEGEFSDKAVPILGTGVKVAIIDSGIDYTHPDLIANYAGGYDYVNKDADPYDDHGHGTHVAGIVAAMRNGSGAVGAAPEADICALKVLGTDGSGSWSFIISALDWCLSNGVSVANFSLGSSSHPGTIVETAFKNAAAAGLIMVASAGNAGEGPDTVGYPAKFPTVIAVGATTSSGLRSSFSSTGPAMELAAPGSSIYSTVRGGGYGLMSGTSMAAPHVAGVAALLVAASRGGGDGVGSHAGLGEEIRTILQTTAEDLGSVGFDPHFGHGQVNAEFATLLAYRPAPEDPEEPDEPESVFDAPGNLRGNAVSSTVTLSWTDNSTNEEGFQIQYGIQSRRQTAWQHWATVSPDTTTYSADLKNGTYLFRVRALAENGQLSTAWSNQVSLKIKLVKVRARRR